MTKHRPGSKRPQSQQSADDPFLAKTISATRWAEENRGLLGVSALVIALLVGGIWYYVDSKAKMLEAATIQLEEMRGAMVFGDPTTVTADLTQYVTRFDGTPQGDEARLLLGRLHLDGASPEAAVAALEPAGRSPSKSRPLRVQAAFLLAKAYEAAGRPADAESLYLRIADATELKFQIWDALAYAAIIRADRGDLAQAQELYQRILDSMEEEDESRGIYEMRLAELRARG